MKLNDSEENPILTQEENQILESYNQLLELHQEVALEKAKSKLKRALDEPVHVSELDISEAQDALLKARALFQVRSNVTESVIITNPVLKAVHADVGTSIYQQDLIRLLEKRDELSFSLSQLSRKFSNLQDELLKLEVENIRLTSENSKLTTSMLDFLEASSSKDKNNDSSQSLQELDEISSAVKFARRRWKIVKGIVSGLIVGSGIDWSRDPKLLDIVLEKDN
ncbi:hypothetical protein HI914_01931 [Erysiphe necator]|nr:hypothetical protein HI914_01931 [Erysiphe necator]